jgi:hypothetical protein
MSIVAVHGPNTFGSKAVAEAGSVLGTVDPTNGLKWDFRLDAPTTRPDQDFSWAFPPDGTPTPQTVADPAVVTYATPGSKTATLTVTNVSRTVSNKALTSNVATLTTTVAHGFKVGQWVTVTGVDATFNGTYAIASTPSGTTFTYALVAANVTSAASGGTVTSATTASAPPQYPPAGSYPITITAVSGAGPLMMEEQSMPDEPTVNPDEPTANPGEAPPTEPTANPDEYNPSEHTVTEVIGFVEDNPDQLERILSEEQAGFNRVTLVSHLEGMRPA